MNDLVLLLNVACGNPLSDVVESRARRLRLAGSGLLAALGLAALWGLAAGSSSEPLGLAALYKVPMVILLSLVSALPAGLLAWRLTRAQGDWTFILLNFVSGVFAGTLALAVLSPLVMLYYHSRFWAGPLLGSAAVFIAVVAGSILFLRNVCRGLGRGGERAVFTVPIIVFLGMQVASLMQLMHLVVLAAPIFPESTAL